MTKKTEKLYAKYEEKIRLEFWSYKEGYSSYEHTKDRIYKMFKEFDTLRTHMYYYDLMSEKDFDETCLMADEIMWKYYDMMNEIYAEAKAIYESRERMKGKKAV